MADVGAIWVKEEGGNYLYKRSDGRTGEFSGRFIKSLVAGDLTCPSCGNNFQNGDEYCMAFDKPPKIGVQCLICDHYLLWSEEKRVFED